MKEINSKEFKKLTKKNKNYINFLKNRIEKYIDPQIAQQMIDFTLSKHYFFNVFKKIKNDSLKNKTPTKTPTIHLIVSPTGGGKSGISKLILKQQPNTVFLDSDLFKNYNPLKNLIQKYFPIYFGYLTGLDSFLHMEHLYKFAIKKKYNLLCEIAPTSHKRNFIDLQKLSQTGYNVVVHILVTSKINALISIHERYERQLLNSQNLSPKLTDLDRAISSFNETYTFLKSLNTQKIQTNLYKLKNGSVALVQHNKNDLLDTYNKIQIQNYKETLKTLNKRIELIQKQMQQRNAPVEQINQFNKIIHISKKQP